MNEKSTIQEALEFLERYRFDRRNTYPPTLSLLYNNNEGLRNALLIVFEDFEYPDFSHMVMKDILKKAYDIHQDMPRVIERDYTGVHAYPRKDISPDEAATFKFAVKNYGHLVDLDTSMTVSKWIGAIKKNYDASDRQIAEEIRVISKAMNAHKTLFYIRTLNGDFKKDEESFDVALEIRDKLLLNGRIAWITDYKHNLCYTPWPRKASLAVSQAVRDEYANGVCSLAHCQNILQTYCADMYSGEDGIQNHLKNIIPSNKNFLSSRWYIHSETRSDESEDCAGFWNKDIGWTTLESATALSPATMPILSNGTPDARRITEAEAQLIVAQDVILQLQEALDSQATQINQMKGMFDDSDGAVERALEEAEEADTRAFKFLSALEQSLALADDHQVSSSSPAMGM